MLHPPLANSPCLAYTSLMQCEFLSSANRSTLPNLVNSGQLVNAECPSLLGLTSRFHIAAALLHVARRALDRHEHEQVPLCAAGMARPVCSSSPIPRQSPPTGNLQTRPLAQRLLVWQVSALTFELYSVQLELIHVASWSLLSLQSCLEC